MSYNINGHSASPPVGSIMQYYGVSDPDGWVICDGVNRTCTDSRYKNVSSLINTTLAISTNTPNSFTPPDLRSKFLYGSSNTSSGIGNTGGTSTQTLVTGNLPSHTHEVTDPGHIHSINDEGHIHKTVATDDGGRNDFTTSQGGQTYKQNGYDTESATTGISIVSAKTGVSIGYTGNGTAFDIMPPYLLINYIMKY